MTIQTADNLVARFRGGERPALARLISLVENDTSRGRAALAELYPDTGRASVIGITGPPGAGKSTLTNTLIREYRSRGKTVGVVAVDPSSVLSGGATLGDRIRMLENYEDEGVYIRSMATRGEMGGLSLAVAGVTHLLDAFGFDIICVETVGVGQDEVDVRDLADTTLLLQVPGLGDSIQTIKAGVLEIADILVVNKSDIAGSKELVRDLRNMLRLGEHGAWIPPIVETVAVAGTNIPELANQIERHRQHLETTGEGTGRTRRRERIEVARLARHALSRHIDSYFTHPDVEQLLSDLADRTMSPVEVADRVVRLALFEVARSEHP